jgi:hypothetical protein
MARPTKDGLEYFPLNTKNDDKFDLIEARHGLEGFAIVVKLYQRIYDDYGYFYPWGDKQKLLFSRSISTPIATIETIIQSAVEFGIFDSDRFKIGILTSRGVQRRYFEASKKRKALTLYTDVLLIIPEKTDKTTYVERVFTGINPQASVVITGNNPESKKESKRESSGSKPELIPEITPQVEEEENTTTAFIQETVKKETGYFIDEKIATGFVKLNLPEEWLKPTLSFYAFAKEVVDTKYPGKTPSELRTLFISAMSWDNLREEYPAWKAKKEKTAHTNAVRKAKLSPPEKCDCGGKISVFTGKYICESCKVAWVFSEGVWNKLEHNASAHIDLGKIRKKADHQEMIETEEFQIPDTF